MASNNECALQLLASASKAGIFMMAFASAVSAESAEHRSGRAAAESVWARLEVIASNRTGYGSRSSGHEEAEWATLFAQLSAAHPHAEASGALAWLLLFGVPGASSSIRRDVDQAVVVMREAANLREPTCGRCWLLLGLLLSIGYPPLVNVAHVSIDGVGNPSLVFVGGAVKAHPVASKDAARLPRDIGRLDPPSAAYAIAAQAGDALGVLVVEHLVRHGVVDVATFIAPGPNQASAITPRRWNSASAGSSDGTCSPGLTAQLGELASIAVDSSDGGQSNQPLEPLAKQEAVARDRARLRHVLADPQGAEASELAEAAELLDSGVLQASEVPRASPSATELRRTAAARGDAGAALRTAVEHLQRNETSEAQPLLKKAADNAQDSAQAEMARYYMRRYTGDAPDAAAAWPHLERAAELGRSDAGLLVAHARAGGNVAGAPNSTANKSEAMQRYRQIVKRGAESSLNEMQAFAAYNLGVLSLQKNRAADAPHSGRDKASKQNAAHSPSPGPSSSGEPSPPPSSSRRTESNGTKQDRNATSQQNVTSAAGHQVEQPGNKSRELQAGSNDSEESSNTSSALQLISDETEESKNEVVACSAEAQHAFRGVIMSQLPVVRMGVGLAQQAARLGDTVGALLLASLMSDVGHPVAHADAASLWDTWAKKRPQHLGEHHEAVGEDTIHRHQPCNMTGWWTTSSPELATHLVSRVFAAAVEGGGFEMFNASLDVAGGTLEGLNQSEVVFPVPTRTEFKHLHSFLWHTSYDILPDGAPIPVALQPPGAVPHLVEYHHQRGKLYVDKHCNTARVEGMWVNWTFHRLGAPEPYVEDPAGATSETCSGTCSESDSANSYGLNLDEARTRDFLHCWIRPEWYFAALEANLAGRRHQKTTANDLQDVFALTTSNDCPCYGAFACRRGDGACVALMAGGIVCPPGSSLCNEVPADLEPARKPGFAARPEVCALAYHRRAAAAGNTDAMHVLSHAYSNGLRGAPKDAAEAYAWSERAMLAGDARGRFDVAYSLEFGLGVSPDPPRAFAMYRELLQAQAGTSGSDVPTAARASSALALLAASGRYLASRFLGGTKWRYAPWAENAEGS